MNNTDIWGHPKDDDRKLSEQTIIRIEATSNDHKIAQSWIISPTMIQRSDWRSANRDMIARAVRAFDEAKHEDPEARLTITGPGKDKAQELIDNARRPRG